MSGDVIRTGLRERVRECAREAGFAAVGFAPADRIQEGEALRRWLESGYNAGMAWMGNPEVREDPGALLPGARTAVVAGVPVRLPPAEAPEGAGRLACYAALPDYHVVIGEMLECVAEEVRRLVDCRTLVCVDTRPVLERALAVRAGLGWAGRNACLVSPVFGPWLHLGILLLDADLGGDPPAAGSCGGCDRCARACPTGAIVAPGVVDARRCASYLTGEHRGAIPPDLREPVGDRLFGCDTCILACPWGSEAETALKPRCPAFLPAADVLAMDGAAFRGRFAGTPVERAGRVRLARNAAVVLGNLGRPGGIPFLERAAASDPSPLVRSHSAWGLGKLGALETVSRLREREADPTVREEMDRVLSRGVAAGGA